LVRFLQKLKQLRTRIYMDLSYVTPAFPVFMSWLLHPKIDSNRKHMKNGRQNSPWHNNQKEKQCKWIGFSKNKSNK